MEICNKPFIDNNVYRDIFKNYPFELSNFQKWAIKGITEDKNILITAHTGSGKTLPAEYAIEYYVNKGMHVIYTTPVKALTNEKYDMLSNKYPNISFGILTGDTKNNPEADVLIMTTEILRNTLFQMMLLNNNEDINKDILDFNIDIKNKLGCVIYDEIHYIGDKDRGTVWEESIMMLPKHVNIIGLSATMDNPNMFCEWIHSINHKDIYLCPNNNRVVPLYHGLFLTYPKSSIKKFNKDKIPLLDKTYENNTLIINNNKFVDKTYYDYLSTLKLLNEKRIYISPTLVLNRAIDYLNNNNLLPAIVFVFSKKNIHKYANSITINLFDEDSTIPNTIKKRCEKILINKIDNYKEYIALPEYIELIKLLEKGIAIHHSGMPIVFREMIELLFAEKLIKVLLATETFAVGINMPAKTVVFTSLTKYSDNKFRLLLSNEYTQMAGRAGRRGIDDKGIVLHLVNLYHNNMYGAMPNIDNYRKILSGKPVVLKSMFRIHYNMVLRLISNNNNNVNNFIDKSMQQQHIKNEVKLLTDNNKQLTNEYDNKLEEFNILSKISITDMLKYKELMFKLNHSRNKHFKKILKEINNIKDKDHKFDNSYELFMNIYNIKQTINKNDKYIDTLNNNINNEVDNIIKYLLLNNFISNQDNDTYTLTNKGLISINIQECHSLAMADIIHDNILNDITPIQLASILSIFTNIRLSENNKVYSINYLECDNTIKGVIKTIQDKYNKYYDMETNANTNFVEDYYIHYDMVDFIYQWCIADTDIKCQMIYNDAKQYDIYVGDFIKAILKIVNIVNELIKICKIIENYQLLDKLIEVPKIILKNIATIQSLYL